MEKYFTCHCQGVTHDQANGYAANSPRPFLGPRTSIGNNVQRAGNNSPPRSRCRDAHLAGNRANAPFLDMIIAQDLRLQIGQDGHAVLLGKA
jgi:hypothetical protein